MVPPPLKLELLPLAVAQPRQTPLRVLDARLQLGVGVLPERDELRVIRCGALTVAVGFIELAEAFALMPAASSGERTLMTTLRPRRSSSATNTRDIPPPPSSRSRRYVPSRVVCNCSRRSMYPARDRSSGLRQLTGGAASVSATRHQPAPAHRTHLGVFRDSRCRGSSYDSSGFLAQPNQRICLRPSYQLLWPVRLSRLSGHDGRALATPPRGLHRT